MHKISCLAFKIPVFLLFFIGLVAACGKSEKSWTTVQNNFEENMAALERLEPQLRERESATYIELEKTMGGLFHNLQTASPAQRSKLRDYLQRPRPNVLPALADANPYSFRFALSARQSVRIPVRSFCLNAERSAPNKTVRYRLSNLQRESPVRRLVFRFQRDMPNSNFRFQSILWEVANPNAKIGRSYQLDQILTHYQIPYTNEMTVSELERTAAFQERSKALELEKSTDVTSLHFELISLQGANAGDLVIYNTADEPAALMPEHLQLRFVPEWLTARRASNSDPEREVLPQFQNIFVDGVNPDELEELHVKVRKILSQSVQTLETLESSSLGEKDRGALRVMLNFGLDLLSQGELEDGSRIVYQVGGWSLLNAIDWATILVPGLNDFRDMYEAVTGFDLITGEKLEWWERGLSMAGVAMGSGAGYRKIMDGILRQIQPDVAVDSARVMADAGEIATHIKSYAGEYPLGVWAPSSQKDAAIRAAEHWLRHQHEFPEFGNNARMYIDLAHTLAKGPPGTMKRVTDKKTIIYESSSNNLVITDLNQLPHTLYRPDPNFHKYPTNLDYFLKYDF